MGANFFQVRAEGSPASERVVSISTKRAETIAREMLEVRSFNDITRFSPCESGEYIRPMGCGIESDFLFTGEEIYETITGCYVL